MRLGLRYSTYRERGSTHIKYKKIKCDILGEESRGSAGDICSSHAQDNSRAIGISKVARVNRGKTMGSEIVDAIKVAHTSATRLIVPYTNKMKRSTFHKQIEVD